MNTGNDSNASMDRELMGLFKAATVPHTLESRIAQIPEQFTRDIHLVQSPKQLLAGWHAFFLGLFALGLIVIPTPLRSWLLEIWFLGQQFLSAEHWLEIFHKEGGMTSLPFYMALAVATTLFLLFLPLLNRLISQEPDQMSVFLD